MKKKNKEIKVGEVNITKSLGCLTDKEWEKEKKRSRTLVLQTILPISIILFLFIGGVFAYSTGAIQSWFKANADTEYRNVKLFESEIRQSFRLQTQGQDLDLQISVETDKGDLLNIGQFHLIFSRIEYFDGGVPQDAYVLYYPPYEWYTKVATGKAKYEEIKVPSEKQKVGVDPTFYKDKDFPYSLYPYDEIEITTNKVIKLIDMNETIYDFYVRIRETNKQFNIQDIRVNYN